ncbi:MAG: UDP-N-acetylmuramoyl-tripeptide--D-alanyl-D-alanine ligase [Candidatus Kaiserbacteria bacterium]|nr:UDP-N-acetylmuramoyl-tripeptide--D-alanyl-D-alanine ligase [Candidatus Kaiserbacteria bacterium]
MFRIARLLVSRYLTLCARLALSIHKPYIIAITGSVGKTTTKDMIAAILREQGRSVRGSEKSYNSSYGVPLSILGLQSGVRNPFIWMHTLLLAPLRALFGVPPYLVLEVGLEYPGDITTIVSWLKPNVGVMTRLGEHPVHAEHFSSREDLYAEKFTLLQAIVPKGIAVCNGADKIQQKRLHLLPAQTALHQFNTDNLSVVKSDIHYDDDGKPLGTDVVLSINGTDETFYIPDNIGDGMVQCLITAVATTRAIDGSISTETLRRAIASRTPAPGRMRILPGKKGSVVIDDSYNASPTAMHEALEILSSVRGTKKIAVLGVMAQLGREQQEVHARVGEKVSAIADHVVVVDDAPYGNREHIRYARNHDEAIAYCMEYVSSRVVFLCKGSQVSRVEYIVSALLADQCDPKTVLVRQEKHWQKSP